MLYNQKKYDQSRHRTEIPQFPYSIKTAFTLSLNLVGHKISLISRDKEFHNRWLR